ncbi:MAG: hypothetical protein JW838_04880 [Spirochaetes bacterium]|nr:hypothetical protein [Spirochaetota bacterium]
MPISGSGRFDEACGPDEPRSIRKRTAATRGEGGNRKRSFLLEKERCIYNDLFRRSGAIVMSSCQGDEVSCEHDALQNGFFTTAIKRALKEGKADTDNDSKFSSDELRDFVSKNVPRICQEFKFELDANQNPMVNRVNLFMKLEFLVAK